MVTNIQYQGPPGENPFEIQGKVSYNSRGKLVESTIFTSCHVYTCAHTQEETTGIWIAMCSFWLLISRYEAQDGVFTIISGVQTITILFPIQTSLQLYGYLVSPVGGQNHMKMNACPWGTLETRVYTALHLWARFTHLNIAGRAQRPKTSPGTSDCTGLAGAAATWERQTQPLCMRTGNGGICGYHNNEGALLGRRPEDQGC